MEFACNKLQELLDSLNKDSNLAQWSSHVNEVGTLIKIKYNHKIKIPVDSTSVITREIVETTAAGLQTSYEESSPPETPTRVSSSMEHETNNRVSEPSDQMDNSENNSVVRTVFKPVSNYQLKRDKERLDTFKTKKNSPKKDHRITRSKSKNSTTQQSDIELARRLDSDSNSTMAISPEKPDVDLMISSPFADANPYSLLQVDDESPCPPQGQSAESTDMYAESNVDVAESTVDEGSEKDDGEEESHEAYLVRTWKPPPGQDPKWFDVSHLSTERARIVQSIWSNLYKHDAYKESDT